MDDGSPVACTPFVTYGGLMDILEKKAHSGNPRVFFFFLLFGLGSSPHTNTGQLYLQLPGKQKTKSFTSLKCCIVPG